MHRAFFSVYEGENKAERYARHGIYLAFDPRDAAGTSLRVTKDSAITAAVLSGHPDSPQFMFLFHVDLLYPGGAQQCSALFSGKGLQEEVLVYLCVVQIDVIVRDVLCRERVGLFRLHCAILGQLKTRRDHIFFIKARKQRAKVQTKSLSKQIPFRFSTYLILLMMLIESFCAKRFMTTVLFRYREHNIYLEFD